MSRRGQWWCALVGPLLLSSCTGELSPFPGGVMPPCAYRTEQSSRCVKSIAATYYRTCALKEDGRVYCWSSYDSPTKVGISDAISFAKDDSFCAITGTGKVYCPQWKNSGPPYERTMPEFDDMVETAGSCALRQNGMLSCWKPVDDGDPNPYDEDQKWTPVFVPFHTCATHIASGNGYCATLADGSVWCWGGRSHDGPPTRIKAIDDAIDIVASRYSHFCVLHATGHVSCWGDNHFGQLGNCSLTSTDEPVLVEGIDDAVGVAVSGSHTCVVRRTGSLECFGANRSGQLGDGSRNSRACPRRALMEQVRHVAVAGKNYGIDEGLGYTFVMKTDGLVWCWGQNRYGQLCNGSRSMDTQGPQLVPLTCP